MSSANLNLTDDQIGGIADSVRMMMKFDPNHPDAEAHAHKLGAAAFPIPVPPVVLDELRGLAMTIGREAMIGLIKIVMSHLG